MGWSRTQQCTEQESSRGGDESTQGKNSEGCVHEKLGNEECGEEWRRQGKTKTGQFSITVAVLPFPVNLVRVHSACPLPSLPYNWTFITCHVEKGHSPVNAMQTYSSLSSSQEASSNTRKGESPHR